MASHGSRMLASARRERDARAANFGSRTNEKEDAPLVVAGPVVLTPSCVAGVAQLPSWEDLMLQQPTIRPDLLRSAKHGSYFALQDRNSMAENWRDIFIVRDADEYVLFDVEGRLIDEASQLVPAGRQSVDLLLEEFTSELKYYRAPEKVRLSPGRQPGNRSHSLIESPQDVEVQVSPPAVQTSCTANVDSTANIGESGDKGDAQQGGEAGASSTDVERPEHVEPAPSAAPTDDQNDVSEKHAASRDGVSHADAEESSESCSEAEADGKDATETRGDVNGCSVCVGMRVRMRQESGGDVVHGGMVAHQGLASLLVATDEGTWITVPLSAWGNTVTADESPICEDVSVVGFAYDNRNAHVTGMLLGGSDDGGVLRGKMDAYCAHIARPLDDMLTRLRERDACARPEAQTFCLGDRVRQLGHPNSPSVYAAVVRVLYSRRGRKQARRLLILIELDGMMQLTFSSSNPPSFFPASWSNWTRVENESNLSINDIDKLDQEYLKADTKRLLAMQSMAAAVKYAGANQTPSQAARCPTEPSTKPNKRGRGGGTDTVIDLVNGTTVPQFRLRIPLKTPTGVAGAPAAANSSVDSPINGFNLSDLFEEGDDSFDLRGDDSEPETPPRPTATQLRMDAFTMPPPPPPPHHTPHLGSRTTTNMPAINTPVNATPRPHGAQTPRPQSTCSDSCANGQLGCQANSDLGEFSTDTNELLQANLFASTTQSLQHPQPQLNASSLPSPTPWACASQLPHPCAMQPACMGTMSCGVVMASDPYHRSILAGAIAERLECERAARIREATAERLECERAARIRHAQLFAFYGLPPM